MKPFAAPITESEYPLWGVLFAIVVFGVIVLGLRFRLAGSGGDVGLVVFGWMLGLEWG